VHNAVCLLRNQLSLLACLVRHTPNFGFKEHGLHFDFSIEQFVQAAFVSGMPYWHVEMPDQERTDGLVQHVEEEPSAKLENVKYYKN
jgi:hypothetical protein